MRFGLVVEYKRLNEQKNQVLQTNRLQMDTNNPERSYTYHFRRKYMSTDNYQMNFDTQNF